MTECVMCLKKAQKFVCICDDCIIKQNEKTRKKFMSCN